MNDPDQPDPKDQPDRSLAKPSTGLATDVEIRSILDHLDWLRASSLSPRTRQAYAADLADLERWASRFPQALDALERVADGHALPPEILAAYLSHCDLAGLAPATIRRRSSAVYRWHRELSLASPTTHDLVRQTLAGVARVRSRGGRTGAAPFTASMARAALPHLNALERAVILVGLVGGLRRSELLALRWGWIERTDHGLALILGGTKNNPEGGHVVGLPRTCGDASRGCPVAALRDLEIERWAGKPPPDAPIFDVSASTLRRIVRDAAGASGENPDRYSPHSLRAGMCSIAASAGVSLALITEQSGHRSQDVAAGYVRTAIAAANPAAVAVANAVLGPPSGEGPDPLP